MDITFQVICMTVSAVLCLVAPTAAAVILIVKRKANWRAFLAGIAAFGVSQLLVRIPLLDLLQNAAWFNLFITTNMLVYMLLLALTAGIFEETGRFFSMKLFMRKERFLTWENGVVFGLGHGGLEAFWLVGISYAVTLVQTLSGLNTAAVFSTPPETFLIGGVERMLTVAVHTGFTMIVLYGVKYKKPIYLLYAVLAHTLVDSTIILKYIGIDLSPWAAEGIIAVFAALALVLIIKIKPVLNRRENIILEEIK
jgi:uncharacterized membrane protein YhfC